MHSRRYASQLSPESVHEEKPQTNASISQASVHVARSRKQRYILGGDQLCKKFAMSAAEDFTNGVSKYQVLFDDFGLWFADNEGNPAQTRRNVL